MEFGHYGGGEDLLLEHQHQGKQVGETGGVRRGERGGGRGGERENAGNQTIQVSL